MNHRHCGHCDKAIDEPGGAVVLQGVAVPTCGSSDCFTALLLRRDLTNDKTTLADVDKNERKNLS